MLDRDRFRCIRCGPEGEGGKPSREHVFPYAIGGALTVPDVCKPCNDVLGAKFDAPLVDHFMVQMRRHRFRIAGHDGRVPDPLGIPGRAADEPVVRVQLRSEGGLRILPSSTKVTRSDRSETRTLLFDAREPEVRDEAVRKIIKRSLRRGREIRVSENPPRKLQPRFEVTHRLPILDWTFGLTKIAYELAYMVVGRAWLEDEIAVRLRAFLRRDEPTLEHLALADVEARFLGFGTSYEMDRLDGLEEWNHYGAVVRENGSLVAEVRVFEMFGVRMVVSGNADAYSVQPPGVAFGLDARERSVLRCNGTGQLTVGTRNAGTNKQTAKASLSEQDP